MERVAGIQLEESVGSWQPQVPTTREDAKAQDFHADSEKRHLGRLALFIMITLYSGNGR